MPGVRSASVSHAQRQAEIEADAGVSLALLVAAVATLGYRARRRHAEPAHRPAEQGAGLARWRNEA